jgi:hypothetical protein
MQHSRLGETWGSPGDFYFARGKTAPWLVRKAGPTG